MSEAATRREKANREALERLNAGDPVLVDVCPAGDEADAEAKFPAGAIRIGACHDHGCVGSVAGIYTASMPVFVVENRAAGNVAFCNSFEGSSPKRLNYGVYDEEVRATLLFLQDVAAPVI